MDEYLLSARSVASEAAAGIEGKSSQIKSQVNKAHGGFVANLYLLAIEKLLYLQWEG